MDILRHETQAQVKREQTQRSAFDLGSKTTSQASNTKSLNYIDLSEKQPNWILSPSPRTHPGSSCVTQIAVHDWP